MVTMPTTERPASPPSPPRNVPSQVIWRILLTDGWAIAGLVFTLLGFIFGVLGTALTLSLVAAFVGLPFAGLGALFLLAATLLLAWRYQVAHKTVEVLEQGEATLGEISNVYQNFHVRVNGRYPWTVEYRFAVSGSPHRGQVTTLSRPDLSQQPGRPVYVLYMRDTPGQNTIYPSPYGYFGL
jgi:membrane protein implicated in regulation of membrane protease activity